MDIVIFLYDGITALDAIGPYQIFNSYPDSNVKFVAKDPGVLNAGTLPLLNATTPISEVESADILCIPGATPQYYRAALADQDVLKWIRKIHKTTKYTTTVCTGSIILAATGLLEGKTATCHWNFYDELATYGVTPVSDRVVREDKIVTSAGVSSGIDMALHLASWEFGAQKAMEIQLRVEYDPEPPFNAGSPDKAPAEVVKAVQDLYAPMK